MGNVRIIPPKTRYGSLTYLKDEPRKFICGHKRVMARFKCDCGKETVVIRYSVTSGNTVSCGCVGIKRLLDFAESNVVHGESRRGKKTGFRSIHEAMLRRCYKAKDAHYKDYGGRGIKVHEPWHDYKTFKEELIVLIGPRLPGLTLDRINVNGNYEPGNVRWLTQKGQLRNKRNNRFIEFNGQKRCVAEWSEVTGLPVTTLVYRILTKWPVERMLTEPVNNRSSVT